MQSGRLRPDSKLIKLDPEVLALFRPPAHEAFFVGLVRSFQILLFLGSCLAAIDFFTRWRSPDLVWLPFVIFLAHLLGFYRSLWLEESFRPNHAYTVAAELIALFVVMWLIETALNLAGLVGTTGISFFPNFIFMAFAWQMGRSWGKKFWYLYVQVDELPEAEGGIPDFRGRTTLVTDHRQSYDEMKMSCYIVGGLEAFLVIAAVALSRSDYFKDYTFNPNFGQNLILWGAVHLLLIVPLLAWLRLRYLRTNWRLNKFSEPSGFSGRWTFYLAGLIGLALLPTFLLSAVDLSGLLKLGSSGDQSFQFPRPPALTPAPLQPYTPPPSEAPQSNFFSGLDLSGFFFVLGIFLFILIVTALLLFAIFNLVKSGLMMPRFQKLNFGLAWGNFLRWLRTIFRFGRQREGFEKGEKGDRDGLDLLRPFRRERLPNDPRGQIRFYYRQVSERARRAGKARLTGQTPDEYNRYLAPNLDEPLKPELEKLTGLYKQARYSPHPVDEAQAGEARQHSEPLVAFFRHRSRRARQEQEKSK